LAQEEREAERLTGNQTYTMDYVTFQVSKQTNDDSHALVRSCLLRTSCPNHISHNTLALF
jgi:hypothetical protein